MKVIQFFIYLLYRFYSGTSSRDIAYEATLIVLTVFITLNVFVIATFFGLDLFNIAFRDDDTKIMQYGKSLILMAPLYFGLSWCYKKKAVAEMSYDEGKVKRGYVFLVLYFFLSLIALVVAALRKDIMRMYFSSH